MSLARWMVLLVAFGISGTAASQAAPASESGGHSNTTVSPPTVDHHQHLLSPAAADFISTPVAPPIELPAAVARLLQSRAALTAEPDALADLFTEDVVFLGFGNLGGWKRTPREVASFIELSFSRGYHLTPVSFTDHGDTAHLAGYYSRGEGTALRHPGHFSMVLKKDAESGWRIAAEIPVFPGPTQVPPIDVRTLIGMLDEAGIQNAIVLSNAYFFDGIVVPEGDVYAKVRAENDWTVQQVRQFPERLVAFCSFNPLAAHALVELERCASSNSFSGLKLHFGTSGVDITNSSHVKQVRQVFEAANDVGWPITVHLAASPAYSDVHATIFIDEILSAAPDVPVVVAHLWGGAGYVDPALSVYADAIAAGRAEVGRLHFDLAQVSMVEGRSAVNLKQITERMRQIGMDRMLYGSDGAFGAGMPPARVWEHFVSTMPLTDEEFRAISTNVLEIGATAPTPVTGLSASPRGELPALLDSLLSAARLEFGVPAMAAAVSDVNGRLASAAVGTGIRGLDVPVGPSSPFHVASLMKPMTATLIAAFVEEGRLSWESTPAEVFPEFLDSMAPAMRGVTLEQLLSHTAGVQPFTSGDESKDLPELLGNALERRLEFTKILLSRPPAVPPGTRYMYSNAGYRIAASMLERVASRPFEVLMQERIWGPLAMTTSGYGWPAREHSTAPWGHYETPLGLLPHPPTGGYALDTELGAPHGDVHMSVEDLARFAHLHLAGLSGGARLLQRDTFRRLHQAVSPASYGLGWAVVPRATRARAGENANDDGLIEFTTSEHDGTAGTFFASVLVSPSRGVAIAVVANADDRAAVEWVRDRIHLEFR